MASLTLYPDQERLTGRERTIFNLYLISALAAFVAMMLLGLAMRMTQATWLAVPKNAFFSYLSLHGAGMVGTMAMVTTAVMWFFLRNYVRLHLWAFVTNFVLFLLGVLCIVIAVFWGGYGALWTYLYPLPAHGMGFWSNASAAWFLIGYLLIGVGELIFYFDAAAGIIARHGNLAHAMGWQWLFGGKLDPDHPKTVVASSGMIIANSLGILAGAVSLVMSLVNLFYPDIKIDPLFAKTLIYWFGHMYVNATIYMGVIAIYELLPRYTRKPYPLTRPFLWGWAASTVLVIIVFPHHLLMDFVMPHWLLVVGQLASWGSGFPVLLVTTWGALMNLYRADMRWSMPPRLMLLALFGWVVGGFAAVLDSTIRINSVMHNTQWVPGHFHFYLLIGVLAMVLALMYHLIGARREARPANSAGDRIAFPVYVIGSLVFLYGFLDGGRLSVARRMADHLPEWTATDKVGSIGAMLVILAMAYFAVRIIIGLLRPAAGRGNAFDRADAAG
ncbi:MAG: cbb3-type cytochrome c oxidase subunit I [Rhodocyclaceae bacterium]|nr:cbb3-type cytochrome c oxidase subunit I [Rhodocyclaceae bacterium]